MPAKNGDGSSAWVEMVAVGRVARAHGNKGEVIINLETDFPKRRFQNGNVVYGLIDGETKPFLIERVRFHGGRPVVELEGINSMNAAEALAALENKTARYYCHQPLVSTWVLVVRGFCILVRIHFH